MAWHQESIPQQAGASHQAGRKRPSFKRGERHGNSFPQLWRWAQHLSPACNLTTLHTVPRCFSMFPSEGPPQGPQVLPTSSPDVLAFDPHDHILETLSRWPQPTKFVFILLTPLPAPSLECSRNTVPDPGQGLSECSWPERASLLP